MAVTDAVYSDWLLDVTRNAHRLLLVELDYEGEAGSSSVVRTDAGVTLDRVPGFTLRNFNSTDCRVYIRSPDSASSDYFYEIWVNGEVIGTIEESDVEIKTLDFRAEPYTTIDVRAVVVDGTGAYSRPWGNTLYVNPSQDRVHGNGGSWEQLGGAEVPIAGVGTVRLASLPYMTDDGLSFDDWLIDRPEIEDQLGDFRGVGDIEAINPDPSVNWLSLAFRGYRCRWLHGDDEWPLDDFRPVASALIADCARLDGIRHRFDLVDGGQRLSQTFRSTSFVYTFSAKSCIGYVLDQAGLPPATFINIPDATRDFRVSIELDETSRVGEVIRRVANSIRAHMRVAQDGSVEVFRPDTESAPELTLTEDDIAAGGVRMLESTPVYKRVRLDYADDRSITRTTGALTGELDEVHVIESVVRLDADATTLADEYALYYSVRHPVWQLRVFDAANLIEVGDYLGVDHPELVTEGVVRRVLRAPLSPWSTIEIEV